MLLVQIEKCLRTTGMTPTRFGRLGLGDPRFVFNLRDGREPRLKTTVRVLEFIRQLEDPRSD